MRPSLVRTHAMTRRELLAVTGTLLTPTIAAAQPAAGWKAGTATVDITPQASLWMAGFALRKQPAQGTALPLKAKALALQAGNEPPAVLVTTDLLGLTSRMTAAVAAEVRRRTGIPRSQLLFNASHTHCGPIVDEQLSVAYDLTAEQWAAIGAYTADLEINLTDLIAKAVSTLEPATIAVARGEAAFARNRRVSFNPDGPVDHAVPILRINAANGALRAIVFGYACHNTTLPPEFVQYHGDYAGVAQAALEQRHQGTVAMFVTGCGADANPHPRGTLDLVQAHGLSLADAVDRELANASSLQPGLRAAYGNVDLPFVSTDVRERWKARLKIEDVYLRRYESLMRSIVDREQRLPSSQAAPVQVWHFGGPVVRGRSTPSDLTLIAIGGEVVVDYATRLAREYPGRRLWVAGYSNDVFGYLPSQRVLREGGYEGGDAMVYYGRPGPFADNVEELIIRQVRRLTR